jgi:hypothetical protein
MRIAFPNPVLPLDKGLMLNFLDASVVAFLKKVFIELFHPDGLT